MIAGEAKSQGYTVIAVALEPLADKSLSSYVDEIQWINVGQFGKLMEGLKKSGVKEAVMAGKVSKSLLYKSKITPDLQGGKTSLFSQRQKR